MRYIGPHKYKSYVTPPDYNDSEHWLSADEFSEKLKIMKENESVKNHFISEIKKTMNDAEVVWTGYCWKINRV